MSLFRKLWRDPDQHNPDWFLGPYFIMCCVMTAAVLLYPLVQSLIGVILLNFLLTAILLSAVYTITRSPQLFRILLVLLIPIIIANWVVSPVEFPRLAIFASAAVLAVMLAAIGAILRHIITAQRISHDIIFGSVAVYLLAGVFWALSYELVNEIMPGMVIKSVGEIMTAQDRATMFPEFTYFSFITLTSVGYGDLVPIGAPARALAIVEGVFGQLYTAILIGKLIGMKVAQK
jgi:hypothetical protein